MPGFKTIGQLSYGGYSFDGTSQVNCKVEYIHDEADRTVVKQKHTIVVKAVVATNASSCDDNLLMIRGLLSTSGKQLTFINRGFGSDLIVNGSPPGDNPGAVVYRDVEFGPKVRLLEWTPIGSNQAAEITWQVETTINYCISNTQVDSALLAINFSASYQIDTRGMTKRTITGYYELAIFLNTIDAKKARLIPVTSDEFRSYVAPKLPIIPPKMVGIYAYEGACFERSQEWSTSYDKRREDFTITDTQIPSIHPYPDYAVSAKGGHHLSWKRPRKKVGAWCVNTITMQLELAEGIFPAVSWLIFSNIVNTRLAEANKDNNGGDVARVMIEDIDISEDVYGRVSSFSFRYRVMGTLKNFLALSGMWQPLGTSWATWASSVNNLQNQYGFAGLKTIGADDRIVDACDNNEGDSNEPTTGMLGGTGANIPPKGPVQQPPNPPDLPPPFDNEMKPIYPKNKPPHVDYSYTKFWQVINPETDSPTVRQAILQMPVGDAPGDIVQYKPGVEQGMSKTEFKMPPSGSINDIIQQGGAKRTTITIMGAAERMGYEPPRPSFSQFGAGSGATEVTSKFACWISGDALGVPIYTANWLVKYIVPDSPGSLRPPKNYENGVESDGKIPDTPLG